MAQIKLQVPHALGRDEALRRIRGEAEKLAQGHAGLITSLTWSDDGARIVGKGFEGRLEVRDTEVAAEVELDWKLALFPLRARREAESWLAGVLR